MVVFHEKQSKLLCGQHCINNLMQGAFFSTHDLNAIGIALDTMEAEIMGQTKIKQGVSKDIIKELRGSSQNVDPVKGYFSLQVLNTALRTFGIELLNINSEQESCKQAMRAPQDNQGYVINLRAHWFCIRKVGPLWWNMNSFLDRPTCIGPDCGPWLEKRKADATKEKQQIEIFVVIEGILPDPKPPISPPAKKGNVAGERVMAHHIWVKENMERVASDYHAVCDLLEPTHLSSIGPSQLCEWQILSPRTLRDCWVNPGMLKVEVVDFPSGYTLMETGQHLGILIRHWGWQLVAPTPLCYAHDCWPWKIVGSYHSQLEGRLWVRLNGLGDFVFACGNSQALEMLLELVGAGAGRCW